MSEAGNRKTLQLKFSGRVIEHLGIQMYQSPVAAVAELVSNAWDADAERVEIELPGRNSSKDSELITVRDNGIGMTFEECNDRFLNVGWCRRGSENTEKTPGKERPVLGRKGIGKFAAFGIASMIRISTTSKRTGEQTVFELDVEKLCSGEYVQTGSDIEVIDHQPPNERRKKEHGTLVTMKKLTIQRRPSAGQFAESMARRFLLHQAQDFEVLVNGKPVDREGGLESAEYLFPRDYNVDDKPEWLSMQDEGKWGVERLSDGHEIKWRIFFHKEPIQEEELRGVAVFSGIKLAQKPFFFNISGGVSGQHGQEYMSGQVWANYIDELPDDIISPERQRINWEVKATDPLESWGQTRIKQLLDIWRDRRGEKRRELIENRTALFSKRLHVLQSSEQKTVKRALFSLAKIPALSEDQLQEAGESILTAWEKGRLRGLIEDLADADDVTSDRVLGTLVEADVLVALQIAEVVKLKLKAIQGLKKLIEKKKLENEVRDYIAERPYLLDPKWETFKKETSLKTLLEKMANKAELTTSSRDRIDLALRSNEHLLVVEFMRPGLSVDVPHIYRCHRYISLIRSALKAQTGKGIERVTGLLVADNLEKDAGIAAAIDGFRRDEIFAFSWDSLLQGAESKWSEFFDIVSSRSPEDERIKDLKRNRIRSP